MISDGIKNYGDTGWLLTRRPSGPFAITLSPQLSFQMPAYERYYYYALLVTNK